METFMIITGIASIVGAVLTRVILVGLFSKKV